MTVHGLDVTKLCCLLCVWLPLSVLWPQFSLLCHGGSGFLSAKAYVALWVYKPTAQASAETVPGGTRRPLEVPVFPEEEEPAASVLKSRHWTSLLVQCLRHCASNAGTQVQSLVGELRSHMPCGKKKKNRRAEAGRFSLSSWLPGGSTKHHSHHF